MNPFGKFLEELVVGEKVGGRAIQVVYPTTDEEALSCHILYIAQDTQQILHELLQKCITKQVLTIGDTDWFLHQGGMLRFVMADNRIRFQISPTRADMAGLKISSKVLRLAEIVELQNR